MSSEKGISVKDEVNKNDEMALPTISQEIPIADSLTTPVVVRTGTTLLDNKRRKINR